jgi:hypothetical protein
LSKISHYLSHLWMYISGVKEIVYQAKKFGIQSLFVSIQFKIDWIVCAWLNIAVTKWQPSYLQGHPTLLICNLSLVVGVRFDGEIFLSKISHYLSNLWTYISGEKQIVYQAKNFGILSLFVLIGFKLDWIVHAWLNIAVT